MSRKTTNPRPLRKPLRFIWSIPRLLLTWILQGPERLEVLIVRRLAKVRRLRRLASLASATSRVLLSPFILLSTAVQRSGQFIAAWWSSRTMRHILWGSPVVLVVVACGYLTAASRSLPAGELLGRYSKAARVAMATQDFSAARVLWDRALQIDPSNLESRFQLALALGGIRDFERMQLIIADLAPADRAVYAPAHLVRAKILVAPNRISKNDANLAESHLLRAIQLQASNVEAHAMLGQLYMSTARPSLAQDHLAIAVRENPALLLSLAKAHSLQGHKREAERYGVRAEEFFRGQAAKNFDDATARLNWAESLMFLEQFQRAVDILKQGLALNENAAYRTALARVYVNWSDTLGKDPAVDPSDQFKLLAEGLRIEPNEVQLFNRMMLLLKGKERSANEIRKSLIGMLARGEAPALVHLMLGTDAGQRGDTQDAVYHLKRAHERDPNIMVIVNNLAWYLSHSEAPDLEAALKLIDLAIAQQPAPQFRDTRGEIQMQLGNWESARDDFEAALPFMKGDRRLHASMGRVYRELQRPELAEEHERLAADNDSETIRRQR